MAVPLSAGAGCGALKSLDSACGKTSRKERREGSGQQPRGLREPIVMLARLVLGTSCRAVLGSIEPALGGLKSRWGSSQHFCSTLSKDVTYRELKNLLNSKDIMLIDVRNTWEILEHGKIPGSINIPLDEVGEALQMNPREFKEKYHEEKPSKSDRLVFSCLGGVRSKKAMDTAISLGFNSAQHYVGGWKEWVTYEISEKKQS